MDAGRGLYTFRRFCISWSSVSQRKINVAGEWLTEAY